MLLVCAWGGRGFEELASGSGSVGVAGECEDLGVVDKAVDHRGGDDVVGEDLAPPAEGHVAGDEDRSLNRPRFGAASF